MEIGYKFEIEVTDISQDGNGIGKVSGMAVFLPSGLVVGDLILAEIIKVKKSYALAQVCEVIKPSPLRTEPFCEMAGLCGGCPLCGMRYESQLALKEKQVRDKLTRLAGMEEPRVHEIIGMEDFFRYRNKVQIPIGERAIGFYRAKSRTVVDCKTCLVSAAPAEAIAEALRRFMKTDHVSAYDPKTGKGLLRHLIVRTAFGTGEVMAILVINGKGIPNHEKLIAAMDEAVFALPAGPDSPEYSLESVAYSIHRGKTADAMGETCITIAGKPTITDAIGNLQFEISPRSFYQVNPAQTRKLYDKVLEYAALMGHETVLDLYCGIGAIGLFCAGKAKKVIGIESVKEAVLNANRNAVINGIVNAEFICGRAEDILPKLAAEGLQTDVVILDPPRAGCRPELLDAVSVISPKRILYVSCDPATLARDIKLLIEKGYQFQEATPVDMFPHTSHVETVALLSKLNADQHIEVELNLDELDLTASENKATYDEIKAYVLETTGLNVSNLYIAQVKRKCGIIERANYNLPKSEDSKQPQCPPDKEAAIVEALKHFDMVT